MKTLSIEELETLLHEHPAWALAGGKIVRNWEFGSFAEALVFVNRVGAMAEAVDHHPDIDIRYSRVRLGLISHDSGGITRRDARMAVQLDEEFPPYADETKK